MKKIFLSLFIISTLFFLIPRAVFAGDNMSAEIAGKTAYGTNVSDITLSEKIGGVIKTTLSLVGMIFLVLMIYAGVLWMTAAGEEEKVTKATNIIKMAVIGLIIVVASYSLTYFVLNAIYGGTGTPAAGGAPTDRCCYVDNIIPMPDEYMVVASESDCTRICAGVATSDCTIVAMSQCPR